MRRYWLILAAIAAVVLAVAVALAGGFARWIVRPLSRVDAAAGEVAIGNLAVRVPAAGRPSSAASPAPSTRWSPSCKRCSTRKSSSWPMPPTSSAPR